MPELWPYYTEDAGPLGIQNGASLSRRFVAEHHALVLYGFHQQSKRSPVHRQGVRLGRALKTLHASGAFSQGAVDRRFRAAVSAEEVDRVAYHLRGLFGQLRSLDYVVPVDYTRLVEDLVSWANPISRDRVRRRWGLQYHAFDRAADEASQAPAVE